MMTVRETRFIPKCLRPHIHFPLLLSTKLVNKLPPQTFWGVDKLSL